MNDYIRTFYSHISPEVAATATKLKKGDVLFAGSGETKEEIGKAVAFLGDEEAYAGGDIIILSPNEGASSKYLGYVLNAATAVNQKASMGQGDAVVHIHAKELSDVVIPFPKLEEQEKIADALSGVDDIIGALDEAIAKKQQIKEGLMQQLLTGKTRLPGFSGKWVDIQLFQIGDMFAGGTPSTFNKEYWDGDICWLHSGAVQNCFVYPSNVQRKITSLGLQHSAARLIKADSVIVAITGATCANIGYLTFVSAANQSVVAIEPTAGYDSKFLYYKLLKSREQILSHKGGSAQSGVSLRSLSSVRIFIPADKKEQKAISDILLSVDAEIISLESKRDKYALIKQGMMQELLTGAIRLI